MNTYYSLKYEEPEQGKMKRNSLNSIAGSIFNFAVVLGLCVTIMSCQKKMVQKVQKDGGSLRAGQVLPDHTSPRSYSNEKSVFKGEINKVKPMPKQDALRNITLHNTKENNPVHYQNRNSKSFRPCTLKKAGSLNKEHKAFALPLMLKFGLAVLLLGLLVLCLCYAIAALFLWIFLAELAVFLLLVTGIGIIISGSVIIFVSILNALFKPADPLISDDIRPLKKEREDKGLPLMLKVGIILFILGILLLGASFTLTAFPVSSYLSSILPIMMDILGFGLLFFGMVIILNSIYKILLKNE